MKVTVLGTGGAFDVNEGNSSFIVRHDNKNYLVDCGWDVFPKLIKQGLADKINYICISHCHDDHIGSLSAYLYYCFYILKKRMKIICPEASKNLSTILDNMGMSLGKEYIFEWDFPSKFISINTSTLHDPQMPSCAFNFNNKLIISGDIGCKLPDLEKYLSNGFIIFHDASTFNSPVHCYFEEFNSLSKKLRKNLFLYHHSNEASQIMIKNKFNVLKSDLTICLP